MKQDRLFQIVYLLLKEEKLSAPELAARLEVSVRTVYRDIETLARAGVPVYALQGKGGGIALMSGFSVERSLLSEREQKEILFALQSLRAASLDTGQALRKLSAFFQKDAEDWIQVDFSRWGHEKSDQGKFQALKEAVLGRRVLHIRYCGSTGQTSERDILPVRLIFKGACWYLQAFCLRAQDYRLFKLNRIQQIGQAELQVPQTLPPVPEAVGTDAPPSSAMVRLKLRFRREAAYRVYDEFAPASIQVESDGSLSTEVEYPFDRWVIGYLLTFGTDVEIREPLWVRQAVAEQAKKIYEQFQT